MIFIETVGFYNQPYGSEKKYAYDDNCHGFIFLLMKNLLFTRTYRSLPAKPATPPAKPTNAVASIFHPMFIISSGIFKKVKPIVELLPHRNATTFSLTGSGMACTLVFMFPALLLVTSAKW
jgi:hypothetical protein